MEIKKNNISSIYYIESGDKDGLPLILIHGFPFNLEMWDGLASHLPAHIRTIRYDVRGHGRSETGDGQYTIEFFADDLIELLNHFKIDKAIVCGLSMGGYIALRAVERNPERFSALILCNTRSEADTDEGKIKRSAAIKTVKEKGIEAYSEEFIKNVFTEETLLHKPKVAGQLKKIIQRNTVTGICGTLLALAARTDTTSSLAKIKVPTLIIAGAEDKIIPLSAINAMHKEIPGGRLHVLQGVAHMSNLEDPEHFNKIIADFLEELREKDI